MWVMSSDWAASALKYQTITPVQRSAVQMNCRYMVFLGEHCKDRCHPTTYPLIPLHDPTWWFWSWHCREDLILPVTEATDLPNIHGLPEDSKALPKHNVCTWYYTHTHSIFCKYKNLHKNTDKMYTEMMISHFVNALRIYHKPGRLSGQWWMLDGQSLGLFFRVILVVLFEWCPFFFLDDCYFSEWHICQ